MSDNGTVYHYTDAHALIKIVKSKQLWASDIQFMNDAMEIVHGANEVMRRVRNAPQNKNKGKFVEMLESELDISRKPERTRKTFHLYAACFCREGDVLSQWRAYGREGGYAIGFARPGLQKCLEKWLDENKIPKQCMRQNLFGDVSYGPYSDLSYDPKEPELDKLVSDISGELDGVGDSNVMHKVFGSVLLAAAMIKNPKFDEEKELRLLLPSSGLPEELDFRVGSIGIVPYSVVEFKPKDVVEIVAGPGHNSLERAHSVGHLIQHCDWKHDIDIHGSEAPVRL
ncbi:DUF2971 domain-containing protein [Actinoallomurus acanthiterrae]